MCCFRIGTSTWSEKHFKPCPRNKILVHVTLGVLFKISEKHPVLFIWDSPPGNYHVSLFLKTPGKPFYPTSVLLKMVATGLEMVRKQNSSRSEKSLGILLIHESGKNDIFGESWHIFFIVKYHCMKTRGNVSGHCMISMMMV